MPVSAAPLFLVAERRERLPLLWRETSGLCDNCKLQSQLESPLRCKVRRGKTDIIGHIKQN